MACLEETPCKPRFKGVENFLRRVAFNLGNTPSQTEVKIISCIPIDVTDLQQKIIQLEKQLEEAIAREECVKEAAAVLDKKGCFNVELTYPKPTPYPCNAAADCTGISTPPACCDQKTSFQKSTVSFMCPSIHDLYSGEQQCYTAPCNEFEAPKWRPPIFNSKRKKQCKNTHMVYYAQTSSSPFTGNKKVDAARREMQGTVGAVNRAPATQTIRKQYKPYLADSTGSSQLSAPVCRDRPLPARIPSPRAADACSCCRGHFYDIDLESKPNRFLDTTTSRTMHQNIDNGNIYYNSSYYDIIPVKEKSDKILKETEKFKKREPKFHSDANYWPEKFRGINCVPLVMNHSLSPPRYGRKPQVGFSKRRDPVPKRGWYNEDSSGNTFVECGEVYIKRPVKKRRKQKLLAYKPVLLKNAECLTHSVNNSECQTESSKNNKPETSNPSEENKTESTLNQIKSILQSVLSHVKTNNQIKNQPENTEMKDAIVQKEMQSNSLGCSRLLNSTTYSPFAMDPYMTSCSRAMAPGPCPACPVALPHVASVPASHSKCLHNYPVFVQQSPARQQCSSCCRRGFDGNRAVQPKQTSTNTLPGTEGLRSKETENLIKEIYKSLAVNIPTKDEFHSDSNDIKSVNVSRNDSGEPTTSTVVTLSRRVEAKPQSEKARTMRPMMSTATTSRATSSSRSPPARTSDDQRSLRSHRTSLLTRKPHTPVNKESNSSVTSVEYKVHSKIEEESETMSEDDSESIEAANEHSAQPTQMTEKKGIFRKVFGSIFKKRRRKVQEELITSETGEDTAEESEGSDSDDYQTVYSQTVERPQRHVTYAPRYSQTAKSSRSSARREKSNRPPYAEQDYRRYWDDRVAYHSQSPSKYSSERSPRAAPPRPRLPGIYFQKLEARHAQIDHDAFTQNSNSNDTRESQSERTRPRPQKTIGLKVSNKRMSWAKRHSPPCAAQWKKFVLES